MLIIQFDQFEVNFISVVFACRSSVLYHTIAVQYTEYSLLAGIGGASGNRNEPLLCNQNSLMGDMVMVI